MDIGRLSHVDPDQLSRLDDAALQHPYERESPNKSRTHTETCQRKDARSTITVGYYTHGERDERSRRHGLKEVKEKTRIALSINLGVWALAGLRYICP